MARSFVAEARRRVGPKKARIRPIIERLIAEHPDATIALRFDSDLELLVSVMLSAQTTDVNVNRVTEKLFVKYRRPEDYLAVPGEELERDIYATGFFRQKAKVDPRDDARLLEVFDGAGTAPARGVVPLPGVARKTANVVAAELGEPQGIVVDTHVRRLSQRLGLTRNEDPVKIERDLQRLVPRERLGHIPAPPDLARAARLHRACAALRGLRASGSLPVLPGVGSDGMKGAFALAIVTVCATAVTGASAETYPNFECTASMRADTSRI